MQSSAGCYRENKPSADTADPHIRRDSWWNRIRSPLVPSVAIEASFVDQCEKVGKGASKDGALEKRQWEEMGRIVRYVLEHEK